MESSGMDTWTRRFFWGGFAVFLLASIPHIAAYFRHFDPASQGLSPDNLWYWGIAFLLAVVIDLSDVLVSIAVMKAMGRGERWYSLIGYWAFICFIMALSWFFNWQYNLVYGTNAFATADKVSVLGFFTIGEINPVIGSAFQVLLLVYTAMAHKFSQKPKTAEELKAEADRLEGLEREQKRIDAYHARNRKPGLIERAKETVKEVKAAAKEVLADEEKTTDHRAEDQPIKSEESGEDTGAQNARSSEGITGEESEAKSVSQSEQNAQSRGISLAGKTSGKRVGEDTIEVDKIAGITEGESAGEAEPAHLASDVWQVVKRYPNVYRFWLANEVKSTTIPEIVEVTKQPKRRVQYQVGRALKTAPRNENLILVSSVIEWLKTAPIPEQTSGVYESENAPKKRGRG